jgi:hypothetical protein
VHGEEEDEEGCKEGEGGEEKNNNTIFEYVVIWAERE